MRREEKRREEKRREEKRREEKRREEKRREEKRREEKRREETGERRGEERRGEERRGEGEGEERRGEERRGEERRGGNMLKRYWHLKAAQSGAGRRNPTVLSGHSWDYLGVTCNHTACLLEREGCRRANDTKRKPAHGRKQSWASLIDSLPVSASDEHVDCSYQTVFSRRTSSSHSMLSLRVSSCLLATVAPCLILCGPHHKKSMGDKYHETKCRVAPRRAASDLSANHPRGREACRIEINPRNKIATNTQNGLLLSSHAKINDKLVLYPKAGPNDEQQEEEEVDGFFNVC
ncbi:hypothetical protein ANN_13895 [Periplaneta americana]|uniref:Uncharacterized protein n=1 Tax=Periplaneta americana TaxID=6978 RepID=A0ABQ8SW57_PERAM|nr:hypothetical protein ANN_13895 [Periplaneta americana]